MTRDIRKIIPYAMGALVVFAFIRMSGDDWDTWTPREEARKACEAEIKKGRLYRVSYPKPGDPKKNFYGRHCELSLYWNRYELQEINGDYKTYEELRKARLFDYRPIRRYYFDGRGVVEMR